MDLNSIYIVLLVFVALYLWRRERVRLLLTPLMLLSFLILYGVGHLIFYAGAEGIVPRIQDRVTTSLILMWGGLLLGIELARASLHRMVDGAERVAADWNEEPLKAPAIADSVLILMALGTATFIAGVFLSLGKLSQLPEFFSIGSTLDKQSYRLELAGGGGYFYHLLIASFGPFMSFLVLLKARAGGGALYYMVGGGLVIAILAAKIGTFHKIPWLIYLLQLIFVMQMARRIEFNLSSILLSGIVLFGGAAFAAVVALPELDAIGILEWLLYRFFEVNNEVIYQTFYVYPEQMGHTWGMNIGLVYRLFGDGEFIAAHTQVADFFGAFGATFDPFYIGDAWVDFGYAGVFVTSMLVGLVLKVTDLYLLSLGKVPLAIALFGSGLYGVFQLQVTSAYTAFLSGGLLLIPILVIFSASGTRAFTHTLRSGRSQAAG